MERQQDREPLGAQQPVPLVQILPDGRLAYVSVVVGSMGIAPPQPLAAHTSAQDLTGKRDRWALIVKIAGALMLIGGIIGLVARGCTAGENRGHTWAFWGMALGIDLLMILTGILGLKAGRQKTSQAARRYKRFLIFFAIVYVLVTGAATFCFAKHEFKHINKYHNGGENRFYTEENWGNDPMEEVNNLRPGEEETGGRPDREGRTIPPYTPSEGEDGWEAGNASNPDEILVGESEFPKNWRHHPKRHDRPEGENTPEWGPRRHRDRSESEEEGESRRHRDGPEDQEEGHRRRRDRPESEEQREGEHRRHRDRSEDQEGGHRRRHPEEGHNRPPRPHDRDDRPRPPQERDDFPEPREEDYFPEAPSDLPTTTAELPPNTVDETVTTAVMPTEPCPSGEEENRVEDASLLGKHKKEKKEKKEDGRRGYGHKDEMPKWSKKDLKRGMMVGMGVAVLLTIGLCSCCVFCACRLVKYSESYEALFPRQSPAPQYSFYYPQPAPYAYHQVPQPPQAHQAPPAQVYQQAPPAQAYQHAPQAQAFQQMPQVVQAVPVNQASLYPNLAPMGVSFPPRAS